MKNLDLNAYGVSEMSHQEMVETDGGGLITGLIILGCIIVAAVATSCDNSTNTTNNYYLAADSSKQTVVNVDANASVVPKK